MGEGIGVGFNGESASVERGVLRRGEQEDVTTESSFVGLLAEPYSATTGVPGSESDASLQRRWTPLAGVTSLEEVEMTKPLPSYSAKSPEPPARGAPSVVAGASEPPPLSPPVSWLPGPRVTGVVDSFLSLMPLQSLEVTIDGQMVSAQVLTRCTRLPRELRPEGGRLPTGGARASGSSTVAIEVAAFNNVEGVRCDERGIAELVRFDGDGHRAGSTLDEPEGA